MPPVWQPLSRQHPVTGRISLYISPIYNEAVEDMATPEALDFIAELTEFAERPEFVYSHKWTPHDIVMWDNRFTMHRVTPHDLGMRRVMNRTTVVGDGPVTAA
jgi:alpha-ketoglutarate-dependent taurine dioxygenase